VGKVDPSGLYLVKHYPTWSRRLRWRDIPKSNVFRYIGWIWLSNSYALLKSQPTRRMDLSSCAYRQRLVWRFSGADILGALPVLKVAARALPFLRPVVQKGIDWAAKNVAKSALKHVYVTASEPWRYLDPALYRMYVLRGMQE